MDVIQYMILLHLISTSPSSSTFSYIAGSHGMDNDVIMRPNYGVFFTKLDRVVPTHKMWTHIIKIPLPDVTLPVITLMDRCPSPGENTGVQILAGLIHDCRINALKNIYDTSADTVLMVDQALQWKQDHISNEVRDEFSRVLQNHAEFKESQWFKDSVTRINYNNMKKWSFGEVSLFTPEQQTKELMFFERNITCKEDSNLLSLKLQSYCQKANKIADEVEHFKNKISMLLRGQLVDVIPNFYWLDLGVEIGFWQDNVDLTIINRDNALFLAFQAPEEGAKKFTVYKLTTIPVPLDQTTRHATLVKDIPGHIAISEDGHHITEINQDELHTCERVSWSKCLDDIPFSYSSKPRSCVSALLCDHYSDIVTYCNFNFVINGVKPGLTMIRSDLALITNQSDFYMFHDHGFHSVDGCMMCFVQIPCEGTLVVGSKQTEQQYHRCNYTNNFRIKREYPVNIRWVRHHFPDCKESHNYDDEEGPLPCLITGYKLFTKPYIYDIPPLIEDISPFDNTGIESVVEFSWSNMLETIKEGDVFHKSSLDAFLATELMTQQHSVDNQIVTIKIIMGALGFCLVCTMIITCAMLLYCCKSRMRRTQRSKKRKPIMVPV